VSAMIEQINRGYMMGPPLRNTSIMLSPFPALPVARGLSAHQKKSLNPTGFKDCTLLS
jgi:hypothetical protein